MAGGARGRPSRLRSRARLPALLLAAAAVLTGAAACGSSAPRPSELRLVAGGSTLLTAQVPTDAAARARFPNELATRLPARLRERRGAAQLTLALSRAAAAAAVARALRLGTSVVDLPFRPVASTIPIPPVRQILHNDCEATALSMLLSGAGVRVGQLRLQRELPRSGPLVPEAVQGSTLPRWGDPEQGFVGRADGSGSSGGFGVYEPPIRALAARYGVRLVDLRGRSVATIRGAVLSGRAVLAWVGLADGPFESWLTPEGREITVNLNEHAVVLVGARPGAVLVDDPLVGKQVWWSEATFVTRWRRLGERALALPSP